MDCCCYKPEVKVFLFIVLSFLLFLRLFGFSRFFGAVLDCSDDEDLFDGKSFFWVLAAKADFAEGCHRCAKSI